MRSTKAKCEHVLPNAGRREISTAVASLAAGQTAALVALIDLLIDKQLITQGEALLTFTQLLADHSIDHLPPASAAATKHIISLLQAR
jgi:hypothetical protein